MRLMIYTACLGAFLLVSRMAMANDHKRPVSYQAGLGVLSGYDGRFVPGLSGAVALPGWVLSGTMGGVATKVYYQNDYTLQAGRRLPFPNLWFSELNATLGAGIHYGTRGYKASLTNNETVTDHDFNLGPAFRVTLQPTPFLYFGFEFIMGFNIGSIGLGFGDTGAFVVGGAF